MEETTQQPIKKRKKLSKKERGFIRDYVKTGVGTTAALMNYDTTDINTANQIALANLRKPTIEEAILSIAEKIPDEELLKVHLEGLRATKTYSSLTEPDKVEPDYATRHKYLDSGYKLKGSYAPEKHETKSININIGDKELEIAKKYEAELNKLEDIR